MQTSDGIILGAKRIKQLESNVTDIRRGPLEKLSERPSITCSRLIKTGDEPVVGGGESAIERIEVWTADLACDKLGLTDEQWKRVCGASPVDNIDAVVHNVAAVNWNADYEKLRPVNVQSAVSLLEAAVKSPKAPKFVFVSGGTYTSPDEDSRIVVE